MKKGDAGTGRLIAAALSLPGLKAGVIPRMRMRHCSVVLLTAVSLVIFGPAQAEPQKKGAATAVAQQLQKLPNFPKIKSIRPLPEFNGQVLEVLIEGNQILYANLSGTRLISGSILEVPSARNLTAERQDALSRIPWGDLPLQDAIVVKKGGGKRKLAVFADPNCGFCKQLESEIDKLDNVTVYYLLMNILGADSAEKNRSIVCAPNPAKAYHAWMKDGVTPPAAPDNCNTDALSRIAEYVKIRGITGTPTLYFEDGSRMVGLSPASAIEGRLGK